jgi:hypothetical protein
VLGAELPELRAVLGAELPGEGPSCPPGRPGRRAKGLELRWVLTFFCAASFFRTAGDRTYNLAS